MKLHNVSNPAAFGIEWQDDGTRYQLVNSRGTRSLMLGMQTGRTWRNTTVVNPERFGMHRPPQTMAEFLAIAEAFTAPMLEDA